MEPRVKKILFTTDLSNNTELVFAYAGKLASLSGAGIVILHVMEEGTSGYNKMLVNFIGEANWQEFRAKEEQRAKDILIGKKRSEPIVTEALRTFCEQVKEEMNECQFGTDEIVVTQGIVVDEILTEARERDCDLIIMGYHGRGRMSEAVMGNTTKEVLRRSKIPVLVVPVQHVNN